MSNKFIIKESGSSYIKEIEMKPTLSKLQSLVGGLIDIPFLSAEFNKRGIDMIINDEGKINGLEPNIILEDNDDEILDILHGPVLFASHDSKGNTIGLSDEQMTYIKNAFNRLSFIRNADSGETFLLSVLRI